MARQVAVLLYPGCIFFDPTHTCPSFEADHMGLSVRRGKKPRGA